MLSWRFFPLLALGMGACARLMSSGPTEDADRPRDLAREPRADSVVDRLDPARERTLLDRSPRDQGRLEAQPLDVKGIDQRPPFDLKPPPDLKPPLDLKLPLDLKQPPDGKPGVDGKADSLPNCSPPCVVTVAGTGAIGLLDGPYLSAQFHQPGGLVALNGELWIADVYNHGIRRLASGGVSTLLASAKGGFADGPLAAAMLKEPRGICLDQTGGVLIADTINNRVRRIAAGAVATVAGDGVQGWLDGPASQARLYQPEGVAANGAVIYIADTLNHRIRTLSAGVVTTLAGDGTPALADGPGANARFYQPAGLAFASGKLYVADRLNHAIRVISIGSVTSVATLAGGAKGLVDGPLAVARFEQPGGVAVDSAGTVYVADTINHRIRAIAGGAVTTVAGSTLGFLDGPATSARLYRPTGMLLVPGGILFADGYNHAIRRLSF